MIAIIHIFIYLTMILPEMYRQIYVLKNLCIKKTNRLYDKIVSILKLNLLFGQTEVFKLI